jgi:hypothetical protein
MMFRPRAFREPVQIQSQQLEEIHSQRLEDVYEDSQSLTSQIMQSLELTYDLADFGAFDSQGPQYGVVELANTSFDESQYESELSCSVYLRYPAVRENLQGIGLEGSHLRLQWTFLHKFPVSIQRLTVLFVHANLKWKIASLDDKTLQSYTRKHIAVAIGH